MPVQILPYDRRCEISFRESNGNIQSPWQPFVQENPVLIDYPHGSKISTIRSGDSQFFLATA